VVSSEWLSVDGGLLDFVSSGSLSTGNPPPLDPSVPNLLKRKSAENVEK
jgi:hypothetical protein